MIHQFTHQHTAPSVNRSPLTAGTKRRAGLVAMVVSLGLVATGCTGGPGSQDDFVDVLTRDDNFALNEAECIADAVFAEYSEDGDAMQKISAAESYDFLTGEDGVAGFDEFFESTVADCTTVGPSSG